jgi:hypothetical protein
VSANGKRKPPRPRIEMVSTARSAAEAAAVVAAVERFLADTAPVAEPAAEPSGWQAAALREGIAARQLIIGEENPPWQS